MGDTFMDATAAVASWFLAVEGFALAGSSGSASIMEGFAAAILVTVLLSAIRGRA